MALLWYLQCRDGLPDPKGSLLSAIPAQVIARANQEVQAAAEKDIQVRERRKQGAYNRYSPRDHSDIGRCYGVPTWHTCRDTHKSRKHRDPFRNPPFSQRMRTNFVVIYFRGCPRPQKYFNTKIYHTKFPSTLQYYICT